MKRKYTFILIFLIIVVLGLTIYFGFKSKNELKYDSEKAESIGLSPIINELERCQNSSNAQTFEERNKYQFCVYDINNSDLEKLKAIEELNGNLICEFDGKNLANECFLEDYVTSNSEIIWEFEWETVISLIHKNYIEIVKEENAYLFVRASNLGAGPYQGSIYVIEDLNSEIITKLKS